MLSVEKAKAIIEAQVAPKPPVQQSLQASRGLVLAESVEANQAFPLFDNSAMDGYAVRADDLKGASRETPVALLNQGLIPAGFLAKRPVQAGTCFQIATGAAVPEGADTVVMQESTFTEGQHVYFRRAPHQGENIRRRGEDIAPGSSVLSPGTLILAAQTALLAAFGYSEVKVHPPLTVSLLSTGSELVDIDQPIGESHIRDSNGYMLATLLQSELCEVQRLGIVPDDPDALRERLHAGLQSDFLLISGGVSVGEHDFVKPVLADLGVEELFWRVAIKPGKPVFFGKRQQTLVFGLPGNPAASYVVFEVLVRPALRKMRGLPDFESPRLKAVLTKPLPHRTGRTHYARGHLQWQGDHYEVSPLVFQGSHSLSSLIDANALIELPPNAAAPKTGETVTVLPLLA